MGDEYEDLVELGFEGVDRFATHFHDRAAAFVDHHYHAHSRRRYDQKTDHRQEEKPGKERARELSPSERGSASPKAPEPPKLFPGDPLPPPEEHLNWNGGYHPQQRSVDQRIPLQQPRIEEFLPTTSAMPRDQKYPPSYSPSIAPSQREREQVNETEYYIDRDAGRSDKGDRNHRRMHGGSDRGRGQRDWRDDDDYERELPIEHREDGRRGNGAHIRTIEEKVYYGAEADRGALSLQGMQGMDRERFAHRPPGYGYMEKPWAVAERPRAERRRSSWSPPRRLSERDGKETQRRRPRSKSPNHYRMVATFVGALAGGVAGSRLKKGESMPNTVATLAGAVVGSIGAREAEKVYDRYRERRREEEWEEEERPVRRERRR